MGNALCYIKEFKKSIKMKKRFCFYTTYSTVLFSSDLPSPKYSGLL
jgi:hypothetical protein